MKKFLIQQEVLLFTGTGFATRQYDEGDNPDTFRTVPGNEKLKEACWNGLLNEMLPEVFFQNDAAAKLYLWQVREANFFFALEMSEYPSEINKQYSIDPYRFMEIKHFN
ncbi:MAG: hypothetical protein ABIN01_04105 [Ferruginibacter sp.]